MLTMYANRFQLPFPRTITASNWKVTIHSIPQHPQHAILIKENSIVFLSIIVQSNRKIFTNGMTVEFIHELIFNRF